MQEILFTFYYYNVLLGEAFVSYVPPGLYLVIFKFKTFFFLYRVNCSFHFRPEENYTNYCRISGRCDLSVYNLRG